VRGAHVRLAAARAENASAVHVVPEPAAVTESSTAEHASYGAADEVVGGSAAPALAFHVVEVTNICRQVHQRVRRNQTQGAGQLEGAKARSEHMEQRHHIEHTKNKTTNGCGKKTAVSARQ
jgi:hypothetical protein